jgi:hypothetical protein
MSEGTVSIWELLSSPEPVMPIIQLKHLEVTKFVKDTGRGINLGDISEWENFEEEVLSHIDMHFGPHRDKGPVIPADSVSWGQTVYYFELSSEAKLDVNLKHIYDKVNVALRHTVGASVQLQGGKALEGCDRTIPDLASNLIRDSDANPLFFVPPPNRVNRCPGELKLSVKWGPGSGKGEDPQGNKQVFSQIHHYTNVHEARVGFILTDTAICAVRRHGNMWGQLQRSQAYELHPEKGERVLNVKLILWFLLSKYASDDSLWGFPQFPEPPAPEAIDMSQLSDFIGPSSPPIEHFPDDSQYRSRLKYPSFFDIRASHSPAVSDQVTQFVDSVAENTRSRKRCK